MYYRDLDVDSQKKLTNNQFLQFPFLRFCPFKPLLFRAFMLKDDQEFPEYAHEDVKETAKAREEAKAKLKRDSAKKEQKQPVDNADEEGKDDDKNITRLVEEQRQKDLELPQCKAHYIEFKDFARYLSVFNRKTPLDLKIKCMFYSKISG